MPELAEVEFYRKQWNEGIGAPVEKVLTHPEARVYRETPAAAFRRALAGRQLLRSEAHGKQMMFAFSGGAWLGLHLGMSGKLFSAPKDYEAERRDHFILVTEGRCLVFSDYRMFGKLTLEVTGDGEAPEWWRSLPPRILDRRFTKARVAAFVKRFPKTPLKTLLLDQRGFPGIGNWMADEICWRLRIAPQTQVRDLEGRHLDDLWKLTRKVSRDAIRVIATDWGTPPDSWLFPHRWKDGGTCPVRKCGSELRRADLRGRTTCWCPACQA